jgi:molybdate transport system substrate-binding protein
MKRRTFFRGAWSAASALLLCSMGFIKAANAQGKPALTISAAASLKDALTEINNLYAAATISVNYGSSGALQHQIEQGDVFISAATKNMDELAKTSLIDTKTRRNIAANRLVLVVPTGAPILRSFKDLNKPIVKRFAMGTPESVPAGKYAQQVLTNLRIFTDVLPKAVFGKDVREVLTQVELGNVDAGIVYKTDALTSSKVKIAAMAPAKLHQPIFYPAAVVSDSKNKAASGDYVRFLAGSSAKKIFRKYGFLAPKK